MYELTQDEITKIRCYYKNVKDSCIFSILEGVMGQAYANCRENPSLTALLLGDFMYLSGDDTHQLEEEKDQFLGEMLNQQNCSELLLVPQNRNWKEYLQKQDRFEAKTRYSLNIMKPEEFDPIKLEELAAQLPKEYHFAEIDQEIARQAMAMSWSREFVGNFASSDDFIESGFGIAVMKEDKLVCAASSYAVYSKGMEVVIATRKEYRRQGLARSCAAALILACRKKNWIPHWDAANLMSVAIATKLGYTFTGEYEAFAVR